MESRVAVLEQIAHDVRARLNQIETELQRVARRVTGLTATTSILSVAVVAILISQGALWFEMGRIGGQLTGISAQLGEITTLLRQHG